MAPDNRHCLGPLSSLVSSNNNLDSPEAIIRYLKKVTKWTNILNRRLRTSWKSLSFDEQSKTKEWLVRQNEALKRTKFSQLRSDYANDGFLENFTMEDRNHLEKVIAALESSAIEAVVNKSDFALIKQTAKLTQAERVTKPDYLKIRRNYDEEVLALTIKKVQEVIARLKETFDSITSVDYGPKIALRCAILYFENKIRVIAPIKNASTTSADKSIVDKIVAELGKSKLSLEHVNKFSDYFTSLPVKKSKEERLKIAKLILKDGTYTDVYKESLLIEDRFGNSLFSMTYSVLPEADRSKYKHLVAPFSERQLDGVRKGKQQDLRQYFAEQWKKLKAESKDPTKSVIVDTPIGQFLREPSRNLLLTQLGLHGGPISFRARYPKDPAKQPEYYQKLLATIGEENLEEFKIYIYAEEIDYTNDVWTKVLLEKILPRKYDETNKFKQRLKMYTMGKTTFERIVYKVHKMILSVGEDIFRKTELAKQIKEMFKLSFKGFERINAMIQHPSIKPPMLDDPNFNETDVYSDYNLFFYFFQWMRSELSRQLAFYHVVFDDTELLASMNQTFGYCFKQMIKNQHYEIEESYDPRAVADYINLLTHTVTEELSLERIRFLLKRAAARRFTFINIRRGNYMHLEILSDDYKIYKEKNLAEVALVFASLTSAQLKERDTRRDRELRQLKQAEYEKIPDARESPKPEVEPEAEPKVAKSPSVTAQAVVKALKFDLFKPKPALMLLVQLIRDIKKYVPTFQEGPWLDEIFDTICSELFTRRHGGLVSVANSHYRKNFCRQSFEVLVTMHSDEYNTMDMAMVYLPCLAKAVGGEIFTKVGLDYVADRYPKLSEKSRPVCAFIFNGVWRKIVKDLIHERSLSLFTYNLTPPPVETKGELEILYKNFKDHLKNFKPLLRNRFIRTALERGWLKPEDKINEHTLLKPVLDDADSSESRITQSQLLHAILLSKHLPFSQVVLTTVFTEQQKLLVMGLEECMGDDNIRVELLKLMRIPGMTIHCLRYVLGIERFDIKMPQFDNHMGVFAKLRPLSDYDFEKKAAYVWAIYEAEKKDSNDPVKAKIIDLGFRTVIFAGLISGSLAKLCTVIRLSKGQYLKSKDFEFPLLKEISEYPDDYELESVWTVGELVHGFWPGLTSLMIAAMVSVKSEVKKFKKVPAEIAEIHLPDIFTTGEIAFRHPCQERSPRLSHMFFNEGLYCLKLELAKAKDIRVKKGPQATLLEDAEKHLATLLKAFVSDCDITKNQYFPLFMGLNRPCATEGMTDKEMEEEADRFMKLGPQINYYKLEEYVKMWDLYKDSDNMQYGMYFNSKPFLEEVKEAANRQSYLIDRIDYTETEPYSKLTPASKFDKRFTLIDSLMSIVKEPLCKQQKFTKISDIITMAFNACSAKAIILPSQPDVCIRAAVLSVMMLKTTELAEFSRGITDHKTFVDTYLLEIEVIKSLKSPQKAIQDSNAEMQDQEEDNNFSGLFNSSIKDFWMIAGLMSMCFMPDATAIDKFIEMIKPVQRSTLEKAYRLYYLTEKVILEQCLNVNKTSLQKFKAFVQAGAAQTEGPLRDQMKKDMLEYGIDECAFKSAPKNKSLHYLDILDLIRDNLETIVSKPEIIADKPFLVGGYDYLVTFSNALIRDIFADKRMAATKISKACTSVHRAMQASRKLQPINVYTNQATDEATDEAADGELFFNPFVQSDGWTHGAPKTTICGKDEKFDTQGVNNQYYLRVWFDVAETFPTKPTATASAFERLQYRDGADYEVKVHYVLEFVNEANVFKFDPKARHHSSLFDLMVLKTSLESQVIPVEAKLGADLSNKFKNADGKENLSVLQLSDVADRPFFSTNFGENLIGHSVHNKKFAKKQRALEKINKIFNDEKSKVSTSGFFPEVTKAVKVALQQLNGTTTELKGNSNLSQWISAINSV